MTTQDIMQACSLKGTKITEGRSIFSIKANFLGNTLVGILISLINTLYYF